MNKMNRVYKIRKSKFTLVEILIAIAIVAILLAITFPATNRAVNRAKFTRWYAFNRQCSNDPACVINFNFQEANGNILNNTCSGSEVEGFKIEKYTGYLRNKNGGNHNFKWIKSGGRWGKYGYKNALQFNGADTYVEIPSTAGVDFTPENDFTVLCWLKFDKLEAGDCPFSKSLWGTEIDAAAQYDLYYNPEVGSYGQGSFDVDVFTTCGTWDKTKVDFNKQGWVHLALRYCFNGKDVDGKVEGKIDVFINGQVLGPWQDTTNENPNTATATGWKVCTERGLNVPLILGAAGCYTKYWNTPAYDPTKAGLLSNEMMLKFFFKGKMDEFLLYKKALSDTAILGHYDMGKE